MTLRAGTIGYSHGDWKGTFYPEKFRQGNMLAYYAERLSTVEVGYSFRELPKRETVEGWARQVPDSFRFALKGWQEITHFKRLRNAEQEADDFLDIASVLGNKQGPILFQLPPNMVKDIPTLDAFLGRIAGRAKVAVEFRHNSWLDSETYDCLRSHSAALCCGDRNDLSPSELVRTSDWGYLRFRGDSYSDVRLQQLLTQIRSNWDEAYVFFSHDDTAIGPKSAARLLELAGN